MSEVNGLNGFLKKMDAIASAYNRIPTEVATIAVNFSKERFIDQAWLNTTRKPWAQRKRNRPGKKRSQTLLVDTGRLKRSIRKIHASQNLVIIGTDVPYAEIHNNGGTINKTVTVRQHTVKSHKRKAYSRQRAGRTERIKAQLINSHSVKTHRRKMNTDIEPRPFIGQSEALNRRIFMHVYYKLNDLLK